MPEEHPFPKYKWALAALGVVATAAGHVDKLNKVSGFGALLKRMFSSISGALSGLSGKRIAVIGPTASGKNTLIARLRDESIPTEYAQTRGSETVSAYKLKFPVPGQSPITFRASKSLNVGGETDERERYWASACHNADIIFYLVDLEMLSDARERTLLRIGEDLRWLRGQALRNTGANLKPNIKLAILANKLDRVPAVQEVIGNERALKEVASKVVQEVDSFARISLGVASNILVGSFPLVMTDDDLFPIFFVDALMAIVADSAGGASAKRS